MFHKFVILLNLRSLFWPKARTRAYENSVYCFIACGFYAGLWRMSTSFTTIFLAYKIAAEQFSILSLGRKMRKQKRHRLNSLVLFVLIVSAKPRLELGLRLSD